LVSIFGENFLVFKTLFRQERTKQHLSYEFLKRAFICHIKILYVQKEKVVGKEEFSKLCKTLFRQQQTKQHLS